MLEEKLDVKSHVRQRQRLQALTESEVWKQELKPFLLEKLQAAKAGMLYDDTTVHWKSVGVYAHIEDLLVFVEEVPLEKGLWERKEENQEQKPKRNLFGWLKRKKGRKPKQ